TSTDGTALAHVTGGTVAGASPSADANACWFRLDRSRKAVIPIRMFSVKVMTPFTRRVVLRVALTRSRICCADHDITMVIPNATGAHASLRATLSESDGNRHVGRDGESSTQPRPPTNPARYTTAVVWNRKSFKSAPSSPFHRNTKSKIVANNPGTNV